MVWFTRYGCAIILLYNNSSIVLLIHLILIYHRWWCVDGGVVLLLTTSSFFFITWLLLKPPLRRVPHGHAPEGALEFLQRNTTCARKVHRKAMITRLAVVAGRRTLCKPIPSWLSTYRYASTLGSKRAFRGWQYTHENRTAWSGRLWSAASFSSSSSGIVMSPLEEYESLVKAGKLHGDPSQLHACRQLDLLFH